MKMEDIKMKTTIYCKPTERGVHSFYLINSGREYFLFSQKYKKGVHNYYANGVLLDDSINFSKSKKDTAIMRTMSKLPMYISYIEQEYGLEILKKTKKKNQAFAQYACA